MALSKQSIRKGIIILVNGETISKEELITMSELWDDRQENFFRKMLKQGGKFSINKIPFEIHPPEKIITSSGEIDTGIVTIPGEDGKF